MERLSGLDAAFLAVETPSNLMHVLGVAVIDPLTASGGFSYQLVRALIEERLPLVRPFRRRAVPVPLGVHNPIWVEDANFELDDHLRRVGLPAPGGPAELAELVASIASSPLDRSRPLWELWLVEGLEHGHMAVIAKVHHAAIDGVSGVELMAALFDLEPVPVAAGQDDGASTAGGDAWRPDRVPTVQELLGHAVVSMVLEPLQLAKAVRNLGKAALRIARRVRDEALDVTVPLTAPRLAMNAVITPNRKVAFASIPLADVKRVKDVFGVKVNDVVLAVVSGAMRRYLSQRGELPDKPLVVVVPTSVRAEAERGTLGNRVSAMFTALPVQIEDPAERLHAVRAAAVGAKQVHDVVGGDTLHEWAELAAPAVFDRAVRLYSGLHLANRHRPIHNLIVSNVPGPPAPIYFAGARLVAFYPMGPIFDGAGLNVTVLSYLDHLDFGFLACRELVPDLDDLASFVPDAMSELCKAAEAEGV